jgi:hypothetical protein
MFNRNPVQWLVELGSTKPISMKSIKSSSNEKKSKKNKSNSDGSKKNKVDINPNHCK